MQKEEEAAQDFLPGDACVINQISCIRLFMTPWTVACQDPLSMGFSRQEYWSGLRFPPPGDLPKPGLFFLPQWEVGSLPLAPPVQLSSVMSDSL